MLRGWFARIWDKLTADKTIADWPGYVAPDPAGSAAVVQSNLDAYESANDAAVAGKLAKASNLSDLNNAATARTNLGLGTLATQNGTFSGTSSGTNTGDQNLFGTIAVSGQSDVVADSPGDTLTLVAGTNVTITTNAGTDAITISASGGLSYHSEAQSTSSPNGTVYVSSLTATGAASNIDIALVPKGTGALLAQVPDSGTGGGNKRGASAVDLQTVRTNANQVASGQSATISGGSSNRANGNFAAIGGGSGNLASGYRTTVAGGLSNTASNGYSAVGGGYANTASASHAVVMGGRSNSASGSSSAVLGGHTNTASGPYSTASGYRATTRALHGMQARASGRFGTDGDAQRGVYLLRRSTTDATATVITTNGSTPSTTNQIVLPNNSSYSFDGVVVAHRTDSLTTEARYTIKGLIARGANASTTTLTWSSVTADYENDGTFDCTLAADTTNGCLKITITGAASKTVRWVAWVETCEVTS